ncbi:Elongator complex protein 4 [Phycomyces nitens]|nr:Elongator complex protein 4 [Phycomyces nitens]
MSFRKRNVDQPKLPAGSRLSAYNGQLLISTGVPSLDDILGGGLPVGTVLLIKEDRATTYAQLLLKYFLAQGIASGHHCALATRDEDPGEMMRNLMWLATTDADEDEDHDKRKQAQQSESDRMKIAWRYSHLKSFDSSLKAKPASPTVSPVMSIKDLGKTGSGPQPSVPLPFCSMFDLTKRIPESVLEDASISLIDPPLDESTDDYQVLLESIRKIIIEGNFSSALPAPPNTIRKALRLGIHSLASPGWQMASPHDLYKFLHGLRGLLRFSFGAAVVTVPAYLYDAFFIRRIEHIVDAVIEIESFAGSAVHNDAPYTQNYHGFFHVHKLPVLNSLLPPSTKLSVLSGGGSNDLAFKLRRKRFAIETFHLPPEGGMGVRQTEPTPAAKKSVKEKMCGSLPGKKDLLEF